MAFTTAEVLLEIGDFRNSDASPTISEISAEEPLAMHAKSEAKPGDSRLITRMISPSVSLRALTLSLILTLNSTSAGSVNARRDT